MIGKIPSGTETRYWLASRSFALRAIRDWNVNGRFVDADGGSLDVNFYGYYPGVGAIERYHAIRPILTLKTNVQIIFGDGQSANTAYQLS